VSARRGRLPLAALDAFAAGCALLACVQLPGALLAFANRIEIALPQLLLAASLLLAMLAFAARRGIDARTKLSPRFAPSLAVAFAVAAAFAQLAPLYFGALLVEAPDAGILLPSPGIHRKECRGMPRRCDEFTLNELGLRGTLVRRATPDTRLVAFVGDSFVFGSGVAEPDTVPAVVARELAGSDGGVGVVNAGVPGFSASSFPGMVRYLRNRLDPDIIVVLFKDDDIDDTDILSRWNRFRRRFWYRMAWVSNIEPIFETARLVSRRWIDRPYRHTLLLSSLDSLAEASSGMRLLVVGAFGDDVREAFTGWLAAHPGVGGLFVGDEPRYQQAERIPHDGHWTEAGSRDVAALIAPAVRAQLASVRRPAP